MNSYGFLRFDTCLDSILRGMAFLFISTKTRYYIVKVLESRKSRALSSLLLQLLCTDALFSAPLRPTLWTLLFQMHLCSGSHPPFLVRNNHAAMFNKILIQNSLNGHRPASPNSEHDLSPARSLASRICIVPHGSSLASNK
jgi:hypothetical protein